MRRETRPADSNQNSGEPVSPDPDQWLERRPELLGDLNALVRCVRGVISAEGSPLSTAAPEHLSREAGSDDEPFQAPYQFTDFELLGVLGHGAMGSVYLAHQKSVGREVALKVLAHHLQGQPRALERFKREAMAAGRLNDPSIPAVYDAGTEAGVSYIAMERVVGVTLDEWLAESRTEDRPPGRSSSTWRQSRDRRAKDQREELLRAFVELSTSLHRAHEEGIVHRDLKPQNLMVTPEGRIRILDFGLAHLEGSGAVTMTGDVVGTPLYMSPEQRAGVSTLDGRSDLFSLAAILHECLLERLPWENASELDAVAGGRFDGLPSSRRMIDRSLHAILERAMRSRPQERYATVEAFGDDLRRLLEHKPIRARAPGFVGRLKLRARRRPTAATFTTFAGILALASVAWLTWFAPSATVRVAGSMMESSVQFRRVESETTVHGTMRSGRATDVALVPGDYWVESGGGLALVDPIGVSSRAFRSGEVMLPSRGVRMSAFPEIAAHYHRTPLVADFDGDGRTEVYCLAGNPVGEGSAGQKCRLARFDFDAVSGQMEWLVLSPEVVGATTAAPTAVDLGDGQVHLFHYDWAGDLHGFRTADLTPIWETPISGAGNGVEPGLAFDLDRDGIDELIIRDQHGTIFARNARTGDLLWSCYEDVDEHPAAPTILERPGQDPVMVVVNDRSVDVHDLGPKIDGVLEPRKIFEYTSGDAQPHEFARRAAVLSDRAQILALDTEMRLHRIDLGTGKGQPPLDFGLSGRPLSLELMDLDAAGQEVLVVVSRAGDVAVLDVQSGREPSIIWRRQLAIGEGSDRDGFEAWRPCSVDWDPDGELRDLVVTTSSQELFVLDGRTGATRFSYQGATTLSAPAIGSFGNEGEETILVTERSEQSQFQKGSVEGRLLAFTPDSVVPGELWSAECDQGSATLLPEVEGSDRLFVLTGNGELGIRRARDGFPLREYRAAGTIWVDRQPIAGKPVTYYEEQSGQVYSIDGRGERSAIAIDETRNVDPRYGRGFLSLPDDRFAIALRGVPSSPAAGFRILDAESTTLETVSSNAGEGSTLRHELMVGSGRSATVLEFGINSSERRTEPRRLYPESRGKFDVDPLECVRVCYPDRDRAPRGPTRGLVVESLDGKLRWWTHDGNTLVDRGALDDRTSGLERVRRSIDDELSGALCENAVAVLHLPREGDEVPRLAAWVPLPDDWTWLSIGTTRLADGTPVWVGSGAHRSGVGCVIIVDLVRGEIVRRTNLNGSGPGVLVDVNADGISEIIFTGGGHVRCLELEGMRR